MSTLQEILDARFGGVITASCHDESDGKVCALELLSVKRGIPFTDRPSDVRCFDLRYINDMDVPDELRTKYMLLMLEAYEGSLDWDIKKKKRVVSRIIIMTVNQLIADLPGLSKEVAKQCKSAKTLKQAQIAADDAGAALDDSAICCIADGAIDAVASAFSSAACSVSNAINCLEATININHGTLFTKACKIWLEAAKD